jgi:hypothetical protein
MGLHGLLQSYFYFIFLLVYIAIAKYFFMPRCLIKHKDTITSA